MKLNDKPCIDSAGHLSLTAGIVSSFFIVIVAVPVAVAAAVEMLPLFIAAVFKFPLIVGNSGLGS
jgi:hypothetical protein